jgi:tetratricopeptide (TPR) repeat protein
MPTINKRFLLKILLVLFAFTGVLVAAHAVQARRIPAALKLQSERAADAGKYDLAVHYLRQYLEFNPEDVDALVRLAELLTKRPPTQRSKTDLLFLYDKILRIDPDRHATRREALTVSLEMGRYTDAITHAQVLLEVFPTEAVLWSHLGTAQAGLNERDAARKSYETAISHAPEDIIGYQRLAQFVWKSLGDERGARAVLDRMVKALPQDPTAYMIRAQFELFTAEDPGGAQAGTGGDLGRATRDLRRALELDPENADASLILADVMQRNRNIPAAHALLREAASLYPRNLRLVRHLSWLELIRGNAPAAITVLEDGLRANPDGFDLMVPLADLLVQQGDTARTADILRKLQERRAPATQVKYLRARVAMREEQWARAVALIEALRTEIVNLPGLELQLNLLLAACFQKLGDPAAEEKAYQRVTNADPKNVLARIGLGNLYMNLGRFDDAGRELDAAVQSPFTTGVVVAQWVKLKARLLVQTNSASGWQRLELATAALAARFGRGSEAVVLRAELLAAQGRTDEAVRLLRKETAVRAGDARLWSALALQTADLNGCAAGLVVIDEGQAAAGDCADMRLARATLYAREPGRVRPLDSLGENIEGWPENEQLRLLSGLIEVYDQVGDQPNVVRTLRRIVARQPANGAMWLKLHERALPGDASAATARAALVKLEGENGPSVLLCDARSATAASAAPLADRLVATFGENPPRSDACLVLAQLKRLTGDEPTAAALTERAFLLEPTKYETAEALLAQFARTGAADRLTQTLKRLAADPRWAGEPFRRMAGHVLSALPVPAATIVLNQCRPLVEHEPGGTAWVAERAVTLKLPDALALIDAATQRPGATCDDWLRKALILSKENAAAGPEVLTAAKARLAPAAYADLVAVFADSAAGSTFVPQATTTSEKRLLAQARLAVKLSRSQPAEGGKVLEAFLAEKDTAPADADWARRNLAMIYAVGGTPSDRVRALALLKDATTTNKPTQTELRATVSVLSTLSRYLEPQDRREVLAKAIGAQQAVYKASAAPTDLFALSQLYRAAGDRVGSRKCLQQLLSRPKEELEKDPSYPLYLTAALEELVDAGEFAAAEKFAGELNQLRVTDFRALAAIARYEAKAGRPDRGLAAAEEYARLADGNAGDYLLRSAQVAELLDELSRLPNVRGTDAGHKIATAAAERFAVIVPNRPEAIVGVAGVLAADGRATEAFERIERLDRYIPTRLRASAGLAIVRGGAVTEQQAQLVLKWLDACLVEEPDSMPLLLNKAEFLARRSDVASAAATFEKALVKEPKNVVALNNLAWLLAADAGTAERALDLVTRATREGGLTGDLLDTRARVRITLKQFAEAERDLAEAISHDPNALRWFHVAVLRMSQTAPAKEEAAKAFAEAKRRGLDARNIHPADLPIFRLLDK